MASKKYLKDYKIVDSIDTRGRLRREAVYIGGDYEVSPQVSKNDRVRLPAGALLMWACYIIALVPQSQAARIMYVIIPFVFSALPMYLMSSAAIDYLKTSGVTTRERAEKTAMRLPSGALITAVLSGTGAVGLLITAVLSWQTVLMSDLIFFAASIIISGIAAVLFGRVRKLKAVKRERSEDCQAGIGGAEPLA